MKPPSLSDLVTLALPRALPAVERGGLRLGEGESAQGRLAVNSRYLERDGQPWFPVMGEFHYTRYPAR
jgi:beta-galactosidase